MSRLKFLWWETCEASWNKPHRPTGSMWFGKTVGMMARVFVLWFAAIKLTPDAGWIYHVLAWWGGIEIFWWAASLIALLAYAISKAGDDR